MKRCKYMHRKLPILLALKNFVQSKQRKYMKKKKRPLSQISLIYIEGKGQSVSTRFERERRRGGGGWRRKKNRMIFFKGHVDKESLGLHFLRNFQVCLFSISLLCRGEKFRIHVFIKICNEKGLKERKGGKIQYLQDRIA